MRLMYAEILWLDPNDVEPGVAALVAQGFNVERLDWVDPYGPTVWVMAWITSNRVPDTDRFLDWTMNIVEPFNGDVVQAGFGVPAGLDLKLTKAPS